MRARGDEVFDAVVVGSGFGGAVTACRLAEHGHSVLVLERGKPYPPGSFPRTPRQWRTAFWEPDSGLHGLFDIWSFRRLSVVCASGLGGGSLIYANVMIPKDEETFVQEDLSAGGREHWPIKREHLEKHYAKVRETQRPRPFPLEHEPYASSVKTGAMREAADVLGVKEERPEIAVLFSPLDGSKPVFGAGVEDGNLHGRPRSTCRLCGECNIGCNFGAKNTLDYTYLSAAQRAGAKLRTCCEVRTLEPLDREDGGYRIGYRQHIKAAEGHPAELRDTTTEPWRTVRARRVILAAGAVGSPRLLLANRARLPGLSPALGTRVSGNGDALAWVRRTTRRGAHGDREDRYLDPSHGPVITPSLHVPDQRSPSGRAYRIQDAGAPAMTEWMWQSLDVPLNLWRSRAAFLRRIVRRLRGRRDPNLGDELAGLLATVRSSAAMLPLLGMGRDVPDGRYVMADGGLDLTWGSEPSKDYYDGLEQGFRDVADALGGELLDAPWKWLSRTVTVHPLGGCPMAEDWRHGVVDSRGRVFNFNGLYVSDGSAMPGPIGANPAFTIAAFAERVAEGIVDEVAAPAS
jgi:cholesterol oxidase